MQHSPAIGGSDRAVPSALRPRRMARGVSPELLIVVVFLSFLGALAAPAMLTRNAPASQEAPVLAEPLEQARQPVLPPSTTSVP